MAYRDMKYLKDALGFDAVAEKWRGADSLPLYLKSQVEVLEVEASGARFLLARPGEEASLPELKRLHAQLSKRAGVPVAVSAPGANARQRKALVSQGVPFVCAGRQASLPFLGTASTEWGKGRLESKRGKKLSPKAQQAAIWGALKGKSYTLSELREATGMSAGQASDAAGELADRGLAQRAKDGRTVTVSPAGADVLLGDSMAFLSSPVLRTMFAVRQPATEALPDAGETALAARGALNPPPVPQKAASRGEAKGLGPLEVVDGELPDSETMQVQVWKYGPLFTGSDRIDDISLALSLASSADERIEDEIASLFGREHPWQQAL